MPLSYRTPCCVIRRITLGTLLFIILMGAVLVLLPIKPFWVDEWFIIDSLKTKDAMSLFGQLDFMQQFPRVYLVILKGFTSVFDYSYFSLRLPSYLVSVSTIVLTWKVADKLFETRLFTRYLLVLILVSAFTFTEYFVEMKQYPMDILLSVLAIWQLIELAGLGAGSKVKTGRYLFLCASFCIAPFFSYTYSITIAPVFVVTLFHTITILRSNSPSSVKRKAVFMQWLPLFICAIGVGLFYAIDAKHLTTDKIMYERWSFLIFNDGNKLSSFFSGFYTLFSQTGSGLVFETLFGVIGICSFINGMAYCARNYFRKEQTLQLQIILYSCLLLLLTLVLFLCKRMPLGTPRLNAFTTPSIAILLIYFINRISENFRQGLPKIILPAILYIGVIGNVFSHYIIFFTGKEYKKMMIIFTSTESAVRLAQANSLPILIASGIAYPYQQAVTDAGAPDPACWVLKTFPAYSVKDHLPVLAVKDTAMLLEYWERVPRSITKVLIGDGISYHVAYRNETQ